MLGKFFELPVVHIAVNGYGIMIVVGFLTAVFVMRRLAQRLGEKPEDITNIALYTLIAGVVGARVFYVVHNFSQFRGDLLSVFATWQGGLEFLGGFILAIIVVVVYMLRRRLSIRRYLDILAVGVMLALCLGRIGCFIGRGCCFGKPADLAWAARFPYGSDGYRSQVYPNPERGRFEPQLELPAEFFGYIGEDGKTWYPADEANKFRAGLKPAELLTDQQKYDITKGNYRCLPVHPSQLYSSANALILCLVLYLFWRKFALTRPGCTLGLMFVLYGVTRFFLESLRDDNPFEYGWWTIYKGGTISQNLGIYQAALGIALLIIFARIKPKKAAKKKRRHSKSVSGKARLQT